jgi:hypothetical protein
LTTETLWKKNTDDTTVTLATQQTTDVTASQTSDESDVDDEVSTDATAALFDHWVKFLENSTWPFFFVTATEGTDVFESTTQVSPADQDDLTTGETSTGDDEDLEIELVTQSVNYPGQLVPVTEINPLDPAPPDTTDRTHAEESGQLRWSPKLMTKRSKDKEPIEVQNTSSNGRSPDDTAGAVTQQPIRSNVGDGADGLEVTASKDTAEVSQPAANANRNKCKEGAIRVFGICVMMNVFFFPPLA